MERSRSVAAGLTAALLTAGVASAAYGVPARLVWGQPREDPLEAAARVSDDVQPLEFARAPALAPVPMRYAPGWLPGDLVETRRSALEAGGGTTFVDRAWVPAGNAAAADEASSTRLAGHEDPKSPYLSVEVEHAPQRTAPVTAPDPARYDRGDGFEGLFWHPEPQVTVSVHQHGLGLDRATMARIARSVRPVADGIEFPLQPGQLPKGLTTTSPDSSVSVDLRRDPGTGRWRWGTVNWCLAFEITVDDHGPAEAGALPVTGYRWLPQPRTHEVWYGLHALGHGYYEKELAVQKRPGSVVTVSLWGKGPPKITRSDLARVADSVKLPN